MNESHITQKGLMENMRFEIRRVALVASVMVLMSACGTTQPSDETEVGSSAQAPMSQQPPAGDLQVAEQGAAAGCSHNATRWVSAGCCVAPQDDECFRSRRQICIYGSWYNENVFSCTCYGSTWCYDG
jgi:hypothetical protein